MEFDDEFFDPPDPALRSSYIGTCDWGYCDRPTVGLAWSDGDDEDDYLTICEECARGDFSPENPDTRPVVAFERLLDD